MNAYRHDNNFYENQLPKVIKLIHRAVSCYKRLLFLLE